uniref:Uncharacterized protein n=1 Tax=Romanomermis culicivorax TaxID=13658 RepID=A0A915I3J9_ROMCU
MTWPPYEIRFISAIPTPDNSAPSLEAFASLSTQAFKVTPAGPSKYLNPILAGRSVVKVGDAKMALAPGPNPAPA